ncbi:MAG: amidohydrolase family protein [Planctomycetes bacterium]|nr:amidohydrolase family protein [Planctomycetota bacterium]
MVEFPIVDTHLHLWDPSHLRYPWLDGIPLLNKPYLLGDFDRTCGSIQVEKMVFVQCECAPEQYERETQWVTDLAGEDPRIEGLVSWAPLEKGEAVCPRLEHLARNPLVKGVRRIIQFEPDPDFCLRPAFIEGVRQLPRFGFSFDICIAHHHLANTIEFVRQCPEVSFILDHIGKPNIKEQVFEPWMTQIEDLARFPSVHCKLSGLVTEADMERWTPKDLKPYLDHVLSCFGVDRVMYGGDWPVAFQATTYPRWVETLCRALDGCSQSELRKVFRENAISFYRLNRGADEMKGRTPCQN